MGKHHMCVWHLPTIIFLISPLLASAQVTLNWVSWDEVMELSKSEDKKILLEVFTPWCGWCQRMDKTTFQDENLIRYLNKNFHLVKLNAEEKEEIKFHDKTYKFLKTGKTGYHELAAELLDGELTFPAVIFLDEKMQPIQAIIGYKTPLELEQMSAFFATDSYKSMPWAVFQKTYKATVGQ